MPVYLLCHFRKDSTLPLYWREFEDKKWVFDSGREINETFPYLSNSNTVTLNEGFPFPSLKVIRS